MSFVKSLSAISTADLEEHLLVELQRYISCLDIKSLTRCGGHASEPQFLSLLKTATGEETLVVTVAIEFNDGDALDCSGQCGGTVVKRRDTLLVTIHRNTGEPTWSTADGVITSDS